jgi:RNA polymerase sigma-70 factor (ECF subfamily)
LVKACRVWRIKILPEDYDQVIKFKRPFLPIATLFIMEGYNRTLFEPVTLELIHQAQAGDEGALGAIYQRYRLDIYRYLYYRVGHLQVAEDLTSEVFERMIRAIGRSHFETTSFEAWLFQIARNLAIDYYRKMNVRDHGALDENMVARDENIDQAVEKNLVGDHLVRALSEVNEAQRDVIILRFAVAMPIAQVAETLHKSIDVVKGLQRRGLMTIRNILSDWEIDDV